MGKEVEEKAETLITGEEGERGYKKKRKTSRTDLPEDIIIIILSMLPVKPLVQLKSVCKSWYSLVNNSSFIRCHINRSIEDKNYTLAIQSLSQKTITFVDFTTDPSYHKLLQATATQAKYPFQSTKITAAIILGTCDGILLLGVSEEEQGHCNSMFSSLYLWNPTTNEYKRLPSPLADIPKYLILCSRIVFGFGYDSNEEDYKVVRILYDGEESDADLYSMKTDSYKNIPTAPCFIGSPQCHSEIVTGVNLNVSIHWVGRKENYYGVVAFHFATEDYRDVPLPDLRRGCELRNMSCAALEGCLTVCRFWEDDFVDVFRMSDYGVKESWTKIFSRECEGLYLNVICTTVYGDLLMEANYDELMYHYQLDFQITYPRILNLFEWTSGFEMVASVRSLVSLKSGSQIYVPQKTT